MQALLHEVEIPTLGDDDVVDVTGHARDAIERSGFRDGLCTVFVAHSTCAITTIECEPGCVADLDRVLETLTPSRDRWEHNVRNHDTNGHAHFRAALFGPSVTIPVSGGRLCLGTWQQIVCVDFDDRARSRRLLVQLLGA
jgi:secondary thiamine-phosphate synthase enzyme